MGNKKRVFARAIFVTFLVIGGGVIGVSLVPPEVEIVEVEKIVYVDVPVEIEVEKIVYIDRIEYVDRIVYVDRPTAAPTYDTCQDIWDYIVNVDTTDRNKYIDDVYMCGDFSEDLVDNLVRLGIDAHYAAVDYGAHAIVIIFCEDGILLIEPQEDSNVFSEYDLNNDGHLEYYEENDRIWVDMSDHSICWFGNERDWYTADGLIIVDMDRN